MKSSSTQKWVRSACGVSVKVRMTSIRPRGRPDVQLIACPVRCITQVRMVRVFVLAVLIRITFPSTGSPSIHVIADGHTMKLQASVMISQTVAERALIRAAAAKDLSR